MEFDVSEGSRNEPKSNSKTTKTTIKKITEKTINKTNTNRLPKM